MDEGRNEGGGSRSAHLYVALVAGIAAVGGLLFGYDTGVISGAILYIRAEFSMDASTEGFVVGVVTLGALAGALGAGILADALGRRPTNIIAGVLFLVASLVSAAAPSVDT